ncbi:ATP-binding protein [Streptosporangium sp. NBC_01495]|uniref:ATP-binding protein n=1 Tax=Streptosporangium sp. NBC_01495 TaxID=2903899 RepID=UPI003FCCC365
MIVARGTFERVFPGKTEQVPAARAWTLTCLPGAHPRAYDIALVVTELVTNAVLHSASALPGATFTVRVELYQATVEVTVTDSGSPQVPAPREDADTYGRGLVVVHELAQTTVTATPAGGRAVRCHFHH